MFFLVFLEFFWFFWFRFLKTKKNLGFFWFFEGSLTWSKAKNKKLKVFLVFSWIVHTCILNIWPKNQKNLEFFWFFAFLQVRLPSKNQKNPRFFLVFKNLNQKKPKKLKENQKKKHLLTWNQNFSKKFWFFGFLVFSRFRKNPFLLKEKSSGPPNKTKKTQGKPKKNIFRPETKTSP